MPAASSVTVTADAWYDIEEGYDYLYAEYSIDGGEHLDDARRAAHRVRARSGRGVAYSRPAARRALFRFRYATDGGVNLAGAFLDDIAIKAGKTTRSPTTSRPATTAGTPTAGRPRPAPRSTNAERYYLVENRQYVGYDHTLQVGPYQFSEAVHPARLGRALPVPGRHAGLVRRRDLRRQQHHRPTRVPATRCRSTPARTRSPTPTAPARATGASRSTRSSARTSSTRCACTSRSRSRPRARRPCRPCRRATTPPRGRRSPTFDDTNPLAYYSSDNPLNSVKVAGVGVKATVTSRGRQRHHRPRQQPGAALTG